MNFLQLLQEGTIVKYAFISSFPPSFSLHTYRFAPYVLLSTTLISFYNNIGPKFLHALHYLPFKFMESPLPIIWKQKTIGWRTLFNLKSFFKHRALKCPNLLSDVLQAWYITIEHKRTTPFRK